MINKMKKITTNLWFDHQAEEAAKFYTSIFTNSSIGRMTYYSTGKQEGGKGAVMTVEFQLEGQDFVALNGGPKYQFTEAISFIINCDTQEELDYYWARLSEGGDPTAQRCGWLKDQYGVSWQLVPTILTELLSDSDPEKKKNVMEALLNMDKKIDINTIKMAYER